MSFRQVSIAALLISITFNFLFLQFYLGYSLDFFFENENQKNNHEHFLIKVEQEYCETCEPISETSCQNCDICQIPKEDCPLCKECLPPCPCKCLACCHKTAKDPIPRSEVRQLDLLHALEDDLIEYRKGKDYRTIHDWNPISFVINLKNRTDRRDSFFKMFDSHNIPPSLIPRPLIFEAVNSKSMPKDKLWKVNGDGVPWKSLRKGFELPGAYGCYLSHVEVLKMMLEKYPGKDLILFEDDAFFYPNDFVKRLTNTFNNIPTDWDIFYIGGALWTRPVDMSDYGFKLTGRVANTHAMFFRSKVLKYLKPFVSSAPGRAPIDILYGNFLNDTARYKAYCPDIPLAGQTASTSDIWNDNNANILKILNDEKNEVDHFKHGKWGGGFWTKNSSKPQSYCEIDGACE